MGVCGGELRRAVWRAEVRARGRGWSAGRLCGGGGGKYGCMACARGVCGTTAGHVRAAAGPGAVGVERRRTRKANWLKYLRSMHHGAGSDHGSKDVCNAPDEPTEKEPK